MDVPDDVTSGLGARDPDAVAMCYEAWADDLYRYLLARCGEPPLAEDMVESAFLALVTEAPEIRGGADGARAWLFRAARNDLIDEQRKRRRRGDQPLEDSTDRPEPAAGPEEMALGGIRDAVVRAALVQLGSEQREVLMLRFIADLPLAVVAEATGRTVGAVKSLQHRALASLGRALGTDPEAELPPDPDPSPPQPMTPRSPRPPPDP